MTIFDPRAPRRKRHAVSARMHRHDSHELPRKAWKTLVLMQNPRYRTALLAGVAAAVEHERVAFGHRFVTVIDVGAHHGQFAIFAAERFPQAEVVCFEPLDLALGRLRATVARYPTITVFPFALGAEQTIRDLHVSHIDDSSSLLAITDRYTTAFPGTEEVGRTPVKTARLDTTLHPSDMLRPCLLKIDVQGYELEVLYGAAGVISYVDEVLVEVSFIELYAGQALADDVICHLRSNGFALTGLYSVKRDRAGNCLQADLLFQRRDHG